MTQTLQEAKNDFSEKIIDKCEGCEHTPNNNFCDLYMCPFSRWRMSDCPAATHVGTERVKMIRGKKRVGQQKQKKGGKG